MSFKMADKISWNPMAPEENFTYAMVNWQKKQLSKMFPFSLIWNIYVNMKM